MTKISNVKVYDLDESIIASGYPMRVELGEESFDEAIIRAKKLARMPSNSGHGNFLTGIRVSFDIKYPQYLTPQLQRYNFIDIVSSQSKMHRLAKMDIEKCCNKYTNSVVIKVLKDIQGEYNSCVEQLRNNPKSTLWQQRVYDKYMELISSLPMGFELTMRVSTNYMQLKNIYNQRKRHKLKEDWGAIMAMIKELPYSEFITGKE